MGDQPELHLPIMAKSHQQQVDENYAAFQKLLPELLLTRAGKFAVMHNGAVIEFFDSLGDAARFGHLEYGGIDFSVQQVTSQSVDLEFYT